MKYKIVASIVVLLIVVAALVLRGVSSSQSVDENGNPIETQVEVQQ